MTPVNQEASLGWRPAAKEWQISCPYGKEGKSWAKGYHPGVDFACKEQPVYAYQNGRCVFCGFDTNWGKYVKIEHKNTGITSYYAHLRDYYIGPGDNVIQGHPIAVSGNSGINRLTGLPHPWHLHFEIRLIGTKTDREPLFYT